MLRNQLPKNDDPNISCPSQEIPAEEDGMFVHLTSSPYHSHLLMGGVLNMNMNMIFTYYSFQDIYILSIAYLYHKISATFLNITL